MDKLPLRFPLLTLRAARPPSRPRSAVEWRPELGVSRTGRRAAAPSNRAKALTAQPGHRQQASEKEQTTSTESSSEFQSMCNCSKRSKCNIKATTPAQLAERHPCDIATLTGIFHNATLLEFTGGPMAKPKMVEDDHIKERLAFI